MKATWRAIRSLGESATSHPATRRHAHRTDRAIALAGVFQAALLTSRPREKQTEGAAAAASLESVFRIDAESCQRCSAVRRGHPRAAGAGPPARPSSRQRIEVARYAISLLQLERKLAADARRLEAIGIGCRPPPATRADRPPTSRSSPPRRALREQISTLSPRIMVRATRGCCSGRDGDTDTRLPARRHPRARLWQQCGGPPLAPVPAPARADRRGAARASHDRRDRIGGGAP